MTKKPKTNKANKERQNKTKEKGKLTLNIKIQGK